MNIHVRDLRQPRADPVEPPIGAIVAYPNGDETRRGVVIHHTARTLHVLDGDRTVQLRGDRRTRVTTLARSAEEYAQRAATETESLRNRQGWCSVPTAMIRDVNSTPVDSVTDLNVVAHGIQTYRLRATPLTLRRKDMLTALRNSFQKTQMGFFEARSFQELPIEDEVNGRFKLRFEIVDSLPAL